MCVLGSDRFVLAGILDRFFRVVNLARGQIEMTVFIGIVGLCAGVMAAFLVVAVFENAGG
ncbi:MAG: hypothetical protein IJ752_06060 [Alphaproteobacteria bacterium]|nr:hypothetical protein [Alphaproteobacteria bacterium]